MKLTKKTKEKISLAHRGKHHTQETKEKIGMAHRGKKHTAEHVEKQRLTIMGEKHPFWGKKRPHHAEMITGSRNPNWKGGISQNYRTKYYSSRYKEWRRRVFERDKYICQNCGVRGGLGYTVYLTAHHIKSFAKYPELRFEVSNGNTLCENCHCKVDKYRARYMKNKVHQEISL